MKSYSSREVISLLLSQGWTLKDTAGDHCHFIHSSIKGKITLPHPVKDVPRFILNIIKRQTGIPF